MQIQKATFLQGLNNIRKIGKTEELIYLKKVKGSLWVHTISSYAHALACIPLASGGDEPDFALGLSGILMVQTISKIPDETVELTANDSGVHISGQNHHISLNKIADATTSPAVMNPQEIQSVNVNVEPLKKYVGQCEHFLGDPARDIRIGSFHVEILQDQSIRITALDNNNISIRGNTDIKPAKQYVLHGRPFKEALDMMDTIRQIGISAEHYFIMQGVDANQVWYQVSIFSSNRPFFQLEKIMMQKALSTMTVVANREQLLHAVDLASLFAKVDLKFYENRVEIAGTVASGSVKNVVPIRHSGQLTELSIRFRASSLMKALKAMTGDNVRIIGGGPNLPLFFSSTEDEVEVMLPIIHF